MVGKKVEKAQHVKTTIKQFCCEEEQENLRRDVELWNLLRREIIIDYVQMLMECSSKDGVIEAVGKRGINKGVKALSG